MTHLRPHSLASTALLAGLVAVVAACARPSFAPLDLASLPGAASFDGAGAVCLLDEQTVRFVPGDADGTLAARVSHRRRMRVFDERGHAFAKVAVSFHPGFIDVVDARARVLRPDGSHREYGRAEFDDVLAFPDWTLYSQERELRLDVGGQPPGSVIETVYEVTYAEPQLFAFRHGFGQAIPVVLSRLRVELPDGVEVRHVARRLDEILALPPEEGRSGARRVLTWEEHDLPALVTEAHGPPLWALQRAVSLHLVAWVADGRRHEGFRDAPALSAWLHQLADGTDEPTEAARAVVRDALRGVADTPRARAAALYEWVQSHVRYCAISMGYGVWRPHAAGRVLDVLYGDCKDKANLLRTLLAIAGISSRLAVIAAHDGYPEPFDVPTVAGDFNHMILLVDLAGESVVVDPTSRTTPFGELPASDQGAAYLPMSEPGAPAERTPVAPPEANAEETTIEATLADDGVAAGRFVLESRGAIAAALREELLAAGPTGYRDVVNAWLDLEAFRASGIRVDALAPSVAPVRLTGGIRMARAASASGPTRLVSASSVLEPWAPRLDGHERETPLLFLFARRLRQTITLRLPPGWTVSRLPPATEAACDAARYRLAWALDGDTLRLSREYELRVVRLTPSELARARVVFESAARAEAEPVVLAAPEKGASR